jgi:hypothetical protein
MAEKLRPDELEAFKEAFDMFDKNQDGTISTKVKKKFLEKPTSFSTNVNERSFFFSSSLNGFECPFRLNQVSRDQT